MSEQPATVDMLYLDLEHLALTTEAQPLLQPRERIVSDGQRFPGFPHEESAGLPSGEETTR